MTTFHVVFAEKVVTYGDAQVSGVDIDEGFKGVFSVEDSDVDDTINYLEEDENVISYSH